MFASNIYAGIKSSSVFSFTEGNIIFINSILNEKYKFVGCRILS